MQRRPSHYLVYSVRTLNTFCQIKLLRLWEVSVSDRNGVGKWVQVATDPFSNVYGGFTRYSWLGSFLCCLQPGGESVNDSRSQGVVFWNLSRTFVIARSTATNKLNGFGDAINWMSGGYDADCRDVHRREYTLLSGRKNSFGDCDSIHNCSILFSCSL